MKNIMTIWLLIFLPTKVFGTAQIPDIIIYEGDTLSLFACPLEFYPNEELIKPENLFGSKGCFFTACWRNYIATWEIVDNKLYLTEVRNACYPTALRNAGASIYAGTEKDSIGLEFADLKLLFPDRYENGKVRADWISGKLISPQGELLYYFHNGFESIYEKELEFTFKTGKLIDTQQFENTKTRQSEFSKNPEKLKEFIYSNIKWKSLPEVENKIIKVYVQYSANENGIIDSVKVMRGFNETFDNEAIRVIKTISDWDVYYRHGKLQRINWTFPVIFSEENRNKYIKDNKPNNTSFK